MGAKYTEAQNKATQKYIKAAYDSIVIRVPKGRREELKDIAKNRFNMSLQAFILLAVNEKINRE
ncbi:MAG: hypothetical protein NC337_14840 [Roseburia sp.]|nr:hypothetical protein [Roseburia sp.]